MKTCNCCGKTEEEIGPFPASYGNRCSVCKNGRHRYGMNRNQQERLLDTQEGKCAICEAELELHIGRKPGAACIDHREGQGGDPKGVRGVLCSACNTTIGNHAVEHFEKIIKYIENPPAPYVIDKVMESE